MQYIELEIISLAFILNIYLNEKVFKQGSPVVGVRGGAVG
jgi:hypothetical protein